MNSLEKTNNLLKILDIIATVAVLVIAGISIYLANCGEQCSNYNLTEVVFSFIISLVFIIFGILNALRISIHSNLNDLSQDLDIVFYLNLGGLGIEFILFGIFFEELIRLNNRQSTQSGIVILFVIIYAFTVFSLLAHRESWETLTSYAKSRIVWSLIFLAVLLVSPYIGIFFGLILLPIMVLRGYDK